MLRKADCEGYNDEDKSLFYAVKVLCDEDEWRDKKLTSDALLILSDWFAASGQCKTSDVCKNASEVLSEN